MKKLPHLLLFLPALALIAGCQAEQQEEAPGEMVAASAVVEIPVTSASDAAMADFTAGQHAMDMARPQDANELFEAAVEKDPTFGFAYLRAANTAASLEEFKTNLDLAAANMEGMSDGERVLVEINMTFLDSDVNKRLQLAKQLVEAYPASPRALLMLANVQGTLQEHGAARTSIKKALELDPTFVPGHRSLGLSYLFNDPKDFNQAETHMQHVVELAPEEASAYINLGDVFRAEQELLEARDSYKTAAEIDATSAIAFSKSGHANSFLGNYDEARVDYDRAIEVAEVGGAKAAYGGFRAYINLYAGNPEAGVEEMVFLLESLDAMGIPEDQLIGARIGALSNLATMAMHYGMIDVAEDAVSRRNDLEREEAATVGTEEFDRATEANIAIWEARLATAKGEFEIARSKAEENARLVEPENNPRKLEGYHAQIGFISLAEGNYLAAVENFRKANPNNIYIKYHLALALESTGDTEEAMRLYTEVAEWNFNSVGYGLVRNAAIERLEQAAV